MEDSAELEQPVAPQPVPVDVFTAPQAPAAPLMSSSVPGLLKSTMQQEVTEPEAGTADGDSRAAKYMLSTLFGERQAPPKTEDGGDTEEVDPALAMVFVRVHTPGSSMPGDGEQLLLKTGELPPAAGEQGAGLPLAGAANQGAAAAAAADGDDGAWMDDAPVTSSLVIMPLLPDAVLHACPGGPLAAAGGGTNNGSGSKSPCCVVVPASAADLPVQAVLDELDALLSRRPVSAQMDVGSRGASGQHSMCSGLSRSNSLGALEDARGSSGSGAADDADEQQQQEQWCQPPRRRSSSQPPAVGRTRSGEGAQPLPAPEVRDAATSISGLERPPSSSTGNTLQHLNNMLMPSAQHSRASSATGSFFGRPASAAAAAAAAGPASSRDAAPAAAEARAAGPVCSPDRLAALYQRFLNDGAARRLNGPASRQQRRTPQRSSAPAKSSPDKAAAAAAGPCGQERAQLYTHMSLLESNSRQPARQNSARSSNSYAQRAAAAAAVRGSARASSSVQERGRSRASAPLSSGQHGQRHGSSPVRQRAVTPGAAPVAQLASPPHISRRRAASSSPDKRTAAAHHAAHAQQQHAASVTRSPGGVVLSQISFGQLLQETVVQRAMGRLEHSGSSAGRTNAWLLQTLGSPAPASESGPTSAGQPGARLYSSMESFRAAAALNPVPEDAALTISSANGSSQEDGQPAIAAADGPACQPPAAAGSGHSGRGRLACRPPALEVGSHAAGSDVPLGLPATSPAAAAAAAAALQQLSACASRHAAAAGERSPMRSSSSRRSSVTASEHKASPGLGHSASMRSHGSAAASTASGSSSSRAWRPGGRSDPKDDCKKLQAYESARRRAVLQQDAPAADADGAAAPPAGARGRLLSPGCSSRSLRQPSSAPPSPGGRGGLSSPHKGQAAAASPRRITGGAAAVGPSTAPSSPRRHGSPSPSRAPSWRPAGAPPPPAARRSSTSPAPPRRRSTSPAPAAVAAAVVAADHYLARGESTISARYGLSSPKSPGGMSRATSGLSHSAAATAVEGARVAAPAYTSLALAALKLAPPLHCSSPPAASQQRRQQQQQQQPPAHDLLAALAGPSCPAKLQATVHALLLHQQQHRQQQRSPSPKAAGGGGGSARTSPSGLPRAAAQRARASYPSGAATAATVEEAIRAAQLALLEKQQQQMEQVRQLVASRRDRWIADAEAELEGAAAADATAGEEDEVHCGDPAAAAADGESSAAGSPDGQQQPRHSAPGSNATSSSGSPARLATQSAPLASSTDCAATVQPPCRAHAARSPVSKSSPPVAAAKAAPAAAKAGSPRKQKRTISALEALLRVSPHASHVPGSAEHGAEAPQQHHHQALAVAPAHPASRPASSSPPKAPGNAQPGGAAAASALAARQPWSAVRRRSSGGLTGDQMLAQLRRQSEAEAAEATDAAAALSEAAGGDGAGAARSASGQLQLDALIKAYSMLNKKNRSASEKAAAVAQLLERIGAGPAQHRRLTKSLDASAGKAATPLPAAVLPGSVVGGGGRGRSSSGSSEQAAPTGPAEVAAAEAAPSQQQQQQSRSPSREHNKQLDVLGRGLEGAGSSRNGPASPSGSASTIVLALKQDSLSSWRSASPERQAAHASLLATPKHLHPSSYAADLAALTTAGSSAHADRSHHQPDSPAALTSGRPAAAAVPSMPACNAGTEGPSTRPEQQQQQQQQQQAVAAVCMRLSSTSSHAAAAAAPIHARISCSSGSVPSAPQQQPSGAAGPQLLLKHSATGKLMLDSLAAKGMTVARAVEWLRAGLQCSESPLAAGASPPPAGSPGGGAPGTRGAAKAPGSSSLPSPKRRGASRPCSPFACFSPSAIRGMALSKDDEDDAATSPPRVVQRSADSQGLRRQLHSIGGGASVAFEMDAAPCLVMVLQQPGAGAVGAERLRVTGVSVLPSAQAGAAAAAAAVHALDLITEGGCYTIELASQADWAGLLAGLNAMLLLLEQASGEMAEQLGATAVEQAAWSRAVQGVLME